MTEKESKKIINYQSEICLPKTPKNKIISLKFSTFDYFIVFFLIFELLQYFIFFII